MNNPANPFDGILLIDKPAGPTSHDIVDRVRRKLKMRRVGHAGTLDPAATGLLIILVGKATKISQYLMSLDKVYKGSLTFGIVTDSHDGDGEIIEENEVPDMSADEVGAYMKPFVGDQYQTPPMFSAKKQGGVPLYKLARKGKTVEREPRFIRVREFDLVRYAKPKLSFVIHTSKGTYVRTLAHDLGGKVGCGAHLSALRRTEIERFSIKDAVALDEFETYGQDELQRALIPVYQAVPSSVL